MTRIPLKSSTLTLILVFIANALLFEAASRANSVVVPNYSTNSQVPNAGEGIFAAVTRHQIVYGASEFPPYPIIINQIQWRPDIYTGGPVTNATIANIQINLSTTTSGADHLSSTFS